MAGLRQEVDRQEEVMEQVLGEEVMGQVLGGGEYQPVDGKAFAALGVLAQ